MGNDEVLVGLPEKFMKDLQDKLEAWSAKGMAPLKELRAVCGKIAWLTGVLPRARWVLRIFYAVLADREAEVNSGAEADRSIRRNDQRPKDHLFVVKRLERARTALVKFLAVAKDRPTRKLSLKPRGPSTATVIHRRFA